MINSIVDAISEALFQVYGSDYEIFTENVEQGLDDHCFLIRCLEPVMDRDLNRRFHEEMLFAVQYFPSEHGDPVQECTDVLETLFDILPDIVVDGKEIHGANMKGQITDGVLTFTVKYGLFLLKQKDPAVDMTDLTVNTEAKG